MKINKICFVLILIVTVVFSFTACGAKDTSDSEITVAAAPVEPSPTPAPETVDQAAPQADSKVTADNFIGSWKDTKSGDGFVNITKTETGYAYEDNDGKYKATLKDGILKVQVSDTEGDTADAYINPDSGHLILSYQGGLSEYERK